MSRHTTNPQNGKVPSEDSDQPGYGSAQSDQSLHCALIGR